MTGVNTAFLSYLAHTSSLVSALNVIICLPCHPSQHPCYYKYSNFVNAQYVSTSNAKIMKMGFEEEGNKWKNMMRWRKGGTEEACVCDSPHFVSVHWRRGKRVSDNKCFSCFLLRLSLLLEMWGKTILSIRAFYAGRWRGKKGARRVWLSQYYCCDRNTEEAILAA